MAHRTLLLVCVLLQLFFSCALAADVGAELKPTASSTSTSASTSRARLTPSDPTLKDVASLYNASSRLNVEQDFAKPFVLSSNDSASASTSVQLLHQNTKLPALITAVLPPPPLPPSSSCTSLGFDFGTLPQFGFVSLWIILALTLGGIGLAMWPSVQPLPLHGHSRAKVDSIRFTTRGQHAHVILQVLVGIATIVAFGLDMWSEGEWASSSIQAGVLEIRIDDQAMPTMDCSEFSGSDAAQCLSIRVGGSAVLATGIASAVSCMATLVSSILALRDGDPFSPTVWRCSFLSTIFILASCALWSLPVYLTLRQVVDCEMDLGVSWYCALSSAICALYLCRYYRRAVEELPARSSLTLHMDTQSIRPSTELASGSSQPSKLFEIRPNVDRASTTMRSPLASSRRHTAPSLPPKHVLEPSSTQNANHLPTILKQLSSAATLSVTHRDRWQNLQTNSPTATTTAMMPTSPGQSPVHVGARSSMYQPERTLDWMASADVDAMYAQPLQLYASSSSPLSSPVHDAEMDASSHLPGVTPALVHVPESVEFTTSDPDPTSSNLDIAIPSPSATNNRDQRWSMPSSPYTSFFTQQQQQHQHQQLDATSLAASSTPQPRHVQYQPSTGHLPLPATSSPSFVAYPTPNSRSRRLTPLNVVDELNFARLSGNSSSSGSSLMASRRLTPVSTTSRMLLAQYRGRRSMPSDIP